MKVISITPIGAEALEGSIQKWQKIVGAFVEVEGTDDLANYDEGGYRDCPLCLEYHSKAKDPVSYERNFDPLCTGCPIMADTGESGCENTPYDNWTADDETLGNAVAMLDYLKDLKARTVVQPAA